MKKTVLGITAAALALLLCSCGNTAPTVHTLRPGDGYREPETVYVTLPAQTVIVTVPGGEQTADPGSQTQGGIDTAAPAESSYTIASERVALGNGSTAELKYPQLQNSGNAVAEKYSNELLQAVPMKALTKMSFAQDYTDKIKDGNKVTYTVTDCKVTSFSASLMTVRFEAFYQVSDTPGIKKFVYTFVLNPSTGSEIKAYNVFSDLASVLDLLGSGKMTREYATDGFDRQCNLKDWIADAKENILYRFAPSAYFSEGKLIIIVDTTSQDGWAEYSIPLESVAQYLKIKP